MRETAVVIQAECGPAEAAEHVEIGSLRCER